MQEEAGDLTAPKLEGRKGMGHTGHSHPMRVCEILVSEAEEVGGPGHRPQLWVLRNICGTAAVRFYPR